MSSPRSPAVSANRGNLAPPSSKRRRQRDSVANETTRFGHFLDDRVEDLRQIWDEVGMDDEIRGERMQTVYKILMETVDQMYQEELQMRAEIKDSIKKHMKTLSSLCRELALPEHMTIGHQSLIDEEISLRKQVEKLKAIKQQRQKEMAEYQAEDQELCDRLVCEPFYIPTASVPTEKELAGLKLHVVQMREELGGRMTELKEKTRRIKSLMRRMEYIPHTEFEKNLVTDSEEEFALSTENMRKLALLADRVEEEYKEFLASIRQKIGELKSELYIWWDKCHVPEEERHNLPDIDEENCNEDMLQIYHSEVGKWKEYYEERQEILEKVTRWEMLFQEIVDWESKQNDVTKYNNRGGNLQKQLQRQNEVKKHLLPRAFSDIEEAVTVWNQAHVVEKILVNGLHPLDHIERIKNGYERSKEEAKLAKKHQLKQQSINETRYGTPVSKRVASPRKMAEVNRSPARHRDPLGVSHRHHPYGAGATGGVSILVRSPMRAVKPPGLPSGRTPNGRATGATAGASGTQIPRYNSGALQRKPMREIQTRGEAEKMPPAINVVPAFDGGTPTPSEQMTMDTVDSYRHFTATMHSRQDDYMVSSFIREEIKE